MAEMLMKKSRVLLSALLGAIMIAALTMWGCGSTGTSSYSDPSPTTTKSATIITAATLKQWIDEGKLNAPFGSKDRVVVVSQSTFVEWTSKGHIPGAVRLDATETSKDRIEGLALAATMMPDGPMMDGLVQKLGIDANTTIVFSLPKNSNIYNQSVPFWNFRYWGFSRDRLKILNGGDDAWDVAGLTLATDTVEKYAASTFCVSNNVALKDMVRYSIGEMIQKVDAIIADPALKNTWQLIDVRGPAITPYLTNALRLQNATMYLTRLNGDATKNFVYPDKQTFETRLGTLLIKDGVTDVYASASKKTVVMCGSSISASPSFVLFDAVLNVPEGNIAMYDGSSSQWNNYNTARLTLAFPSAATDVPALARRNAWTFNSYTSLANPNALTKNRAQGAFTMTGAVSIWSVSSPVLGPTDTGMNQIETADKAYIVPVTSGTGGGGSTGGGSTPGGC